MKAKLFAPILGAVVCLAVLAGCQTGPKTPPPPKSTTSIEIKTDNRAPSISISVNTAIRIVLPGPIGGPDYRWVIVSNNSRVLHQTTDVEPALGSAGSFSVTFHALYAGRSIVRFAAIKSGALESSPDDLYQVTVTARGD